MDTQQAHQKNIDDTEALCVGFAASKHLCALLGALEKPAIKSILDEMASFSSGLSKVYQTRGEAQVCAMFDWAVYSEDVDVVGKLHTGIISSRREVVTPCGIADRVLTHEDGTITVVEIKAAGSRRDHVQGLGQALLYAEGLRDTGAPDVRMALIVCGDLDPFVAGACKTAGVVYIAFPHVVLRMASDYGAAALKGSQWQPQ